MAKKIEVKKEIPKLQVREVDEIEIPQPVENKSVSIEELKSKSNELAEMIEKVIKQKDLEKKSSERFFRAKNDIERMSRNVFVD